MKTKRILLGLTGLLTILAITVTPASAIYQANQANTSQGPLAQTGNNPTFTVGSGAVTCTVLEKGVWHIQTKFSKVASGEVKQDLTKDGPHESFTGQYNNCSATGGFGATVNSGCTVQAIQITTTKASGAVMSECEVNIGSGACIIKIAAGNSNFELAKITTANIASGQEFKSEVTGVTETATGIGCAIAGISSGKAGEFKATVAASSQKSE